ncbi:hypothetical protein HN446_00890 [bacterium]|jgi:hypothetical protein|nr:hypothetical protein [bacterium]
MLIQKWHSWLDMPKFCEQWHKDDIADELQELKEACGFFKRWSEKSDVVYTYTRAKWSGYKNFKCPLNFFEYIFGLLYMFPKYTLRFLFFLHVGKCIDKTKRVKGIRNPKKPKKLYEMAKENKIDPELFVKLCQKKLKYWPLLP